MPPRFRGHVLAIGEGESFLQISEFYNEVAQQDILYEGAVFCLGRSFGQALAKMPESTFRRIDLSISNARIETCLS